MRRHDVIRIPADDPQQLYRVEFINYARAYVVPLARRPRVIQTAQGLKTIHTTNDGAGFNISPMSPVEIVDTDDLPSELRARLRRLMEAA
jgi:hypothetical protein